MSEALIVHHLAERALWELGRRYPHMSSQLAIHFFRRLKADASRVHHGGS